MASAPSASTAATIVVLDVPARTEDLVRYLRRLGFAAEEVDYGVLAIDGPRRGGELDLDACLGIWERVHPPVRLTRRGA